MTLRVAVIGSGPAGIYTAEALVKQAAEPVEVDVLERLPTPYGLVRYGVAPDHTSIKSIANYLRRVLELPEVRFLGGVELGEHLSVEDLLRCYDAVVYATGAMVDRRIGIPGEDLPGSVAATDFVNWYCGHPDVPADAFTLDSPEVAVIGVGNVAVDVVRVLAKTAEELSSTDVPHEVLERLADSQVKAIHMIGRRGPEHAKFTLKELRELGELANADVCVRPEEAVATERRLPPADPRQRRGAARPGRPASPSAAPAAWTCGSGCARWRSSAPTGWRGSSSNAPGCRGGPGGGHRRVRDASRSAWCCARSATRASRCRGCRSTTATMTVPNEAGRVRGARVRGGLAQARPHRRDRHQQVRRRGDGPHAAVRSAPGRRPAASRRAVDALLAERGVRPVTYEEWLAIEAAEAALAKTLGRGERVKLVGLEAMLRACRPLIREGNPCASPRADHVRRFEEAHRVQRARYPGGRAAAWQPVHTVYVPADRFGAGTVAAWGDEALALAEAHLSGPGELAEVFGLPARLARAVHERVLRKLATRAGRGPAGRLRGRVRRAARTRRTATSSRRSRRWPGCARRGRCRAGGGCG